MSSVESKDSEIKKWKCYTCGNIFKPIPPNYKCIKCGSTSTVPDVYEATNSKKTPLPTLPEIRGIPQLESRRCSKCGEVMEDMFIHIWGKLEPRAWDIGLGKWVRPLGYLFLSKGEPTDYRYPPKKSSLILHGQYYTWFSRKKYQQHRDDWVKKVLHCKKCKLILFEYD
jgi:hypothetical protein